MKPVFAFSGNGVYVCCIVNVDVPLITFIMNGVCDPLQLRV